MILVTGSSGFIGSHLVTALRDLNKKVLCHDPVEGATDDEHQLNAWLHNGPYISAIFHLGAISDTTCEDRQALIDTNIILPANLAAHASKRGIPFIYASSASVYGNGAGPLNLYAHSKNTFDKEMLTAEEKFPGVMKWYGLRFFNVYGSGEDHKGTQASVIWQMKHAGLRRIFNAFAQRDFVHVSDVVKVMLWFWKALPEPGIYDVGSGQPRTFMDAAIVTRGLDFDLVKMPKQLEGRYQYSTKADLTKLRAAGYDAPFLRLEDGVKLV